MAKRKGRRQAPLKEIKEGLQIAKNRRISHTVDFRRLTEFFRPMDGAGTLNHGTGFPGARFNNQGPLKTHTMLFMLLSSFHLRKIIATFTSGGGWVFGFCQGGVFLTPNSA
jgi:hypothetical protein